MARFRLDPSKTAMENVYDSARIAVVVLMRSHRWYGLVGETRDELFDLVLDATVSHFLTYKVRGHRYRRVANDGRPLTWQDNMLSSCFSVCHNIADRFLKEFNIRYHTDDITPMEFALTLDDRFPLYVSEYEKRSKNRRRCSYDELQRTQDKVARVREFYEDYVDESKEMGLCDILPFHKWLHRNGYATPEILWMLLPKEERKEMLHKRRFTPSEDLDARELNERIYMRNYSRRRRAENKRKINDEISKLYGPPSPGYRWVKYKSGRISMWKLKTGETL